ncbi:hypothetical protein GH733_015079 [Mirounga leonina]|nr:hypothetical protein GH733_015079 [Mirounga leonina]
MFEQKEEGEGAALQGNGEGPLQREETAGSKTGVSPDRLHADVRGEHQRPQRLRAGRAPLRAQQRAQATGKPAQYIAVHGVPDQLTAFGGSTEACALRSLHSIGKIGGAQNRSYSKLLCGPLAERLHLKQDFNKQRKGFSPNLTRDGNEKCTPGKDLDFKVNYR